MIYLRNMDQKEKHLVSPYHANSMKVQRWEVGSKSVPLPTTLTLEGDGWSIPCPWLHYSQERNLIPMVQKAWWATGSIWIDAESRPTRV
jgi:hypothetical protein